MMYINSYASVTESQLSLDGHPIELMGCEPDAHAHLTQAYRHLHIDYPKFFKMDNLCKAGFLASELLMGAPQSEVASSDWAVVSFSSTSSHHTDVNYQRTISQLDNYYPSPSLFVYTLANIMIGEISIRHHLQGESSSYILPAFDAPRMVEVIDMMCAHTPRISHLLCAWADCLEAHIDVAMFLLSNRPQQGSLEFNATNLNYLRN